MTFSIESKVQTWDPMLVPKTAAGQRDPRYWDLVKDRAEAEYYGTAYWEHGRRVPHDQLRGSEAEIVMTRALNFIAAAARDRKPFLAVIWFHEPHLPVVAGPDFARLYPDVTPCERNYYGCVTAMDAQNGRLRQKLRALGVAENTVLWFCSDNGPEGVAGRDPGSAWPAEGAQARPLGGWNPRASAARVAGGHSGGARCRGAMRDFGYAVGHTQLRRRRRI